MVVAPCLIATVTPAIGSRSPDVPAEPSQSSETVPNTWPYEYDSLLIQVPNTVLDLFHWPAYHATDCDGDACEASLSMPVKSPQRDCVVPARPALSSALGSIVASTRRLPLAYADGNSEALERPKPMKIVPTESTVT